MMWLKTNFILLFLTGIFLTSFILRFININQSPPGFNWDEAALGYNAYSILKTGKDEYGQSFPLIFKSFGDYKPGAYIYLTVLFVYFFGLNEIAVRLPSIILGSLIPSLAFLLIRRLSFEQSGKVAIFTAVFLTISPWAIHFSRGAWEANVAFFESLLAVYLLLRSVNGKKIFLMLSGLLFCLSIYTYQSTKLFGFLIFFGIIFLNRTYFLNRRNWILTVFLSLLFGLTIVSSLIDPTVRARLTYLNQLNYPRREEEVNLIKSEDNENLESPSPVFFLFHTEILNHMRVITTRYINYFMPSFLFNLKNEESRSGNLNYSLLHFFELPFLILGFTLFIKNRFKDKKSLLLWGLIAPLPAALSRDLVSPLRSLPLAFFIEFLSALGFVWFLQKISVFKEIKFINRHIIYFGLAAIVLVSLFFYWDDYFIHTPKHGSEDWLYGYKEAVSFVETNKNNYEKIVFTTKYNEPYIFYLFYTKYNPLKFQPQAKLEVKNFPDVGEVPKIDNIEFEAVDWQKYRFYKKVLLVGSDVELPDHDVKDPKKAKFLKVINYLDGKPAFKFVETVGE